MCDSKKECDGMPCQVVYGNDEICGETKGLEIIFEFHQLYQQKMNEIEAGGGDNLQAKVRLQKEWICDLTAQNRMLAKAVEELEAEATTRVNTLQSKLKHSASCLAEVMKRYQEYGNNFSSHPFQTVFYLQNDLKNILEFLRRIRESGEWSIDGLQFYEISYQDLFGCDFEHINFHDLNSRCPTSEGISKADRFHCDEKDKTIANLKHQLLEKNDEICKLKNSLKEREKTQKGLLEMREALTEEVANKHDAISVLKKDITQLEEKCLQAERQTCFKDDIIKEMRKEIRKFKQESTAGKYEEEIQELKKTLEEYQKDNGELESLRAKLKTYEYSKGDTDSIHQNLQNTVDFYTNSIQVLEEAAEKTKLEIAQHKMTIQNLQEALVLTKQELEQAKLKSQQEVSGGSWTSRWFGLSSVSSSNDKLVHDV